MDLYYFLLTYSSFTLVACFTLPYDISTPDGNISHVRIVKRSDPFTCRFGEFKCRNQMCISEWLICDRENNCGDNSDELICDQADCSPEQFSCNNLKCIPMRYACDGQDDCEDNSDEINCDKFNCLYDYVKCNNHRCIDNSFVCDGIDDCGDNSDELNCHQFNCSSDGRVKCNNHKCIYKWFVCNGKNDCGDNSDELNCDHLTCLDGEFKCNYHKCISMRYVCDGDNDCGDNNDELNCEQFNCSAIKRFKCSNHKCVDTERICNGEDDCGDNSDELNCDHITCSNGKYKCTNNICIYGRYVCDGDNDCGDNSDELNCEICSDDEFECNNRKCIHKQAICNGDNNCGDNSDELNCEHFNCLSDGRIKCNNHRCIYNSFVCDGKDDCGDNSDELNCEICSDDEFECNNRKCIHKQVICNGDNNCGDNSDELNCEHFNCLSDGRIKCNNHRCIYNSFVCNGKDDCGDNSDELNCDKCSNKTCQNEGDCVIAYGEEICSCKEIYAGTYCEIDRCANISCKNGGHCDIQDEIEICRCPKRYTGFYCEIDRCANISCLNGGHCDIQDEIAICSCPESYTGFSCEIVPHLEEPEPQFADVIPNVTVPAGRTVNLPCVVDGLGKYKVAWIHSERNALLTFNDKIFFRDPRYKIYHNNFRTWRLQIQDVREEDSGHYICQINTYSTKKLVGIIEVVVSPKILDDQTSSDTDVREGSDVSLRCKASWSPPPEIRWQREDEKDITLGTKTVLSVEGEYLNITKANRLHMAAYLCIAANGVQPAVSKRIMLNVRFAPMIWTSNQLVAATIASDVTLECTLESHPKPVTYWAFSYGDEKSIIFSNPKHNIVNIDAGIYKMRTSLTIKKLRPENFGSYSCVAMNALGHTEHSIILYEYPKPQS